MLDENGNYNDDVFVSPTGYTEGGHLRVVHFDIIDEPIQAGDHFSINIGWVKTQIIQAIAAGKVRISGTPNRLGCNENGMTHVAVTKLNKEDYIKVITRYHGAGFYSDDYTPDTPCSEESHWERKGEYHIGDYNLVECGYEDKNYDWHNYYAIDTTRILVNNVNLTPENIEWDEEGKYFSIFLDLQEDAVIDFYAKIVAGNSHFDAFDPNDNVPYGAISLQPNHIVTRPLAKRIMLIGIKLNLKQDVLTTL